MFVPQSKICEIVGECGVCSFETLKNNLINCRKTNEIPKDAKSVILFTFPYKVREEKPLNISRYAAVCDYHTVVGKILKEKTNTLKKAYPEYCFVPFADNSPIPEVYAAAAAQLGVLGENGLLITKKYGSFVFIGEIVTDLPIESKKNISHCIGCGKCKTACPVGLDKENCLSKISQQKKPLLPEQEVLIGENGSVWGCDICSEICPMNKNRALTYINEFKKSYRHKYTLNEDGENRPYNWRGKEVIERNFRIIGKD
ncbi:MAG: DUF1730 domain-containing protein [Ruminococcaceae bacterium]|nr:DUF1730 domain-containing protein [Oscillospiraceae bacterium]